MPPKRTTKAARGGKPVAGKHRSEVDAEPRLQSFKRPYTARTATLEKTKAQKIAVKPANEPIEVDKSGSDEINLNTESDEPADVDVKPKANAKAGTKPRQAPARNITAPPRATVASKALAKGKTAPRRIAKRKAPAKELDLGDSDDGSSSGDSSIEASGRLTLAKLKRTVDRHAKWCPFVRMNKKLKTRVSMMARIVDQNAGASDDDDDEAEGMMVVDGRLEKVTGGRKGGRGAGRGAAQSTKQPATKGAANTKVVVVAEKFPKATAKSKAQATKAGHMAPKSLSPGTINDDRKAMHLDSASTVPNDEGSGVESDADFPGIVDAVDDNGKGEEIPQDSAGGEEDDEDKGEGEEEGPLPKKSRKWPECRNLTPKFQDIARESTSSLSELGKTPENASQAL